MASVATHLPYSVRSLLAEAAVRLTVGDAEFERHSEFWKLEIKNELLVLDQRPLHVPSADAHDHTCLASEKYKTLCRSMQ